MGDLAAIYTRVSLEDGEKISTPRQERLCRAWIDVQGWSVAAVYEDVSVSAYQAGVVRAALERLLLDVQARRVSAVVVWRLDRLVRSPAEYERVLAACQRAGVLIRSVTEPVDSVDPMGIAVGRMFALFAGLESDVRSARLRSRNLERAQAGVMPRAGIFGLSPDGQSLVPAEATLIREATERVLRGEPVRLIARDWETRGVVRRDGKPFRYDGLASMLSSPSVCGDRVYLGEVVAEGCYPAILDRLTAARVRNVLATGRRHSYRKPIRHLLAGMVSCGRCGGPMIPMGSNTRFPRFHCCHPLQCGQISISEQHLDNWVTQQVLNRLRMRRTPGNRKPWDQRDANAAVVALNHESDVLGRLNQAYFVNAELTHAEWVRLRDSIALTTAQEVARAGPPHPPGLDPSVPLWKAAAVWDQLDLQTRHDVIGVELHQVVIHPPIHRRWHPDRAVPVWVLPDPKGWAPTAGPEYAITNQYGTWAQRSWPGLTLDPAPPGASERAATLVRYRGLVALPGIRLLGDVALVGADGSVTPLGDLAGRLLLRLILASGSPVAAEDLVVAVWGDGGAAPELLRRAVWRLRRQMSAAGFDGPVIYSPDGYWLDVAHDTIDAECFTRLVETSGAALRTPAGARALAAARQLWPDGAEPFGHLPPWARTDADRLVALRQQVRDAWDTLPHDLQVAANIDPDGVLTNTTSSSG